MTHLLGQKKTHTPTKAERNVITKTTHTIFWIAETKATIDNLIRDTLWAELPECYDELSISAYRRGIYEYVFTRYNEVA